MKDRFSKQASLYAKYRPRYPQKLFDYILAHVTGRDAAWDCATGNGQTAIVLSKYFTKVVATDISEKQLEQAEQADNINYSLQPAEHTNFNGAQFDLVTVSQALHWINTDLFYPEVKRVCKPGAMIAVWMYALLRISPEIDEIIDHHHFIALEKYWDPQRKIVDDLYAHIDFPFEEIKCPLFYIEYEWSLEELEGYLNTWSALQTYIATNNENPVPELMSRIKPKWSAEKMRVNFPIHLRMGKIFS